MWLGRSAAGAEAPSSISLPGSRTGAQHAGAGGTHVARERQHCRFRTPVASKDLYPRRSINTRDLRQCGFRLIFSSDHLTRKVQEQPSAHGQKEPCCASDESTDLNRTSAGTRGCQKSAQRASQDSSNR